MWPRFTLCICALLAAQHALAEPKFTPVAVPDHIYAGGWEHFVGGGIASLDCNGDGLPELYAAGGENPALMLRNTSMPGGTLQFVGDTPVELALTGVTGAYPLDFDNDAVMDLVVLRAAQNMAMRGLGDCRFEETAVFDRDAGWSTAWSTAFSATWEPGQTLPTMVIGNYVDRADPNGPFEACDANQLFRPKADGYGVTTLTPGYCALSMLFSDWGRHGRADLRVSNDRHYYVNDGQEQMWAMDTMPRLLDQDDGWQAHKLWGMGIASRDLNRDGVPEVFLTSMGDQRLQALDTAQGAAAFKDARFERGTTAHRPFIGDDGRPSTGWHAAFGDVDNDGRDDLFIAKGNVDQMPTNAFADPNNLLMQGADGVFSEAALAAGIATTDRSRGAVLADLNLDGLLDLAVVNRRAPMEVYQNVTPGAGNWLEVSLQQPAANRFAIGAWIEIQSNDGIIAREITVGGGHAGGSAGAEHFGLGSAETVQLRVIWPNGGAGEWAKVAANQRITLERD